MWFGIYRAMSEYYVEIFLGISIGAFVISIILLISLIKENMSTNTIWETYAEENEVQKLHKY
ncbi:MAG: hypothetical protein ABF295_03545 [Flavobacteriaceae bacterium]